VPVETATTENSDLQRAVAFERGAHEQAARRVERLPYGFSFLDERLPLVFFANLLWVTATAADDAISAAQLIADADRRLANYTHRWAIVEHEPLWRALDDDLAAAGWGSETHVYMTHRHAPDRLPDLSAVREVGHDGVLTAERRFTQAQPWCTDPEAGRQVIEHHRRIGELLGERCFAAYAGDEVCAYAKLRHVDGVAQIEDVVVLAEHRGAGLGRLVTSAALAAAMELEPELLFIVADDDDWPKELYGRLGFAPMGRVRAYHRLPPP
jgi:ribosomal protein S18 acetylase RimI-like enzyme